MPAPEPARTPTRVEALRAKLKAGGHESPYRLRKQLPEPVFGQIKQARGFRQFLLRGFAKCAPSVPATLAVPTERLLQANPCCSGRREAPLLERAWRLPEEVPQGGNY